MEYSCLTCLSSNTAASCGQIRSFLLISDEDDCEDDQDLCFGLRRVTPPSVRSREIRNRSWDTRDSHTHTHTRGSSSSSSRVWASHCTQIPLAVNKANRKLFIFITEAFNTLDSRDFKGSETQSTLGCFITLYIEQYL